MKMALSGLSYCRSRPRICFASLVVTTLTLVIPFLLGAGNTQPSIATALFQVDRFSWSPLGDASPRFDGQEFNVLKKTQLAKLKSKYVAVAALRSPGVAGLSILANEKDPVDWLDQHLTVDFPQDGEVLRLTLSANGPPDQIVTILSAVAKAYQDEVIVGERHRRAGNRDLLQRNLSDLNKETKEKLNTYLDIARESDHDVSGENVKLKAALRRFDRIDAEILKIESTQALSTAKSDAESAKQVREWLAQLRKRQSELGQEISERAVRSADLETRKDEIAQLQLIANDMSLKLEQLELEASGPERIKMLQDAVLVAK